MSKLALAILAAVLVGHTGWTHELTISGEKFLLDGAIFHYTGVSFFNAIYNPTFNRNSEDRKFWMKKFQKYGINSLRIWCQWDSKRGFADAGPESTLFKSDGSLRAEPLQTLKSILHDTDELGMVVELVLFSQESWRDQIRYPPAIADLEVAALTRELVSYRNATFQIWNEFSERVLDHLKTIKSIDPKRLVTNSPGGAGMLGDDQQNEALDYLSPHTSRQTKGPTWEIAPREIAQLQKRFKKPVVDDEPARNGTEKFGGPKNPTYPMDHILHIYSMWQVGAAGITYHHNMFQTGYGSPAVPPSGIPDPEFSPYHREVFEFIARAERYRSKGARMDQ